MHRGRLILLAALALVVALILAVLVAGPALAPGASPTPTEAVLVPPADPLPWAKVVWRKVDGQPAALGLPARRPRRIDRIAPSGIGVVATGRGAARDLFAGLDAQLTWTSRDGVLWERGWVEAGVRPGNTAEAHELVAGPRGVVLVGSTCCMPEERAAWHSIDGLSWNRVAAPFALTENVMDVVAGPNGFVAVGEEFGEAAMRIWFTPDGRQWERVRDPALGAGRLNAVVWSPAGYLAAGVDTSREDYDAAVWHSGDGQTWKRVALDDPTIVGFDDSEFDSLVAFADGIFAAGRRNPVEDRQQCQDLLGGALVATTDTSLSCGWGRSTLWMSDDGRRWRGGEPVLRDPDGAVLPGRPVDYYMVRAGGPGLVNVIQGDDGQLVWTSADGFDWAPIVSEPPMPTETTFADFVVLGRRIIAVGEGSDPEKQHEPSRAVVWIGDVQAF